MCECVSVRGWVYLLTCDSGMFVPEGACACVRACVRAGLRASVCVRLCACVRMCVRASVFARV